jgi:hypothetical protein
VDKNIGGCGEIGIYAADVGRGKVRDGEGRVKYGALLILIMGGGRDTGQ